MFVCLVCVGIIDFYFTPARRVIYAGYGRLRSSGYSVYRVEFTIVSLVSRLLLHFGDNYVTTISEDAR